MEQRVNPLKRLPRNLLQTFNRVEKSTTDWLQQHHFFPTKDSYKPGTPSPPTKQQPKLQSTPLSFYDGFDCVGGVPAFHFTGEANENVAQEKSSATTFPSYHADVDARSSKSEDQAESSDHGGTKILECTFSKDSSKFAVYFSSGVVKVWETDRGKLVFQTVEMHDFQFCCLSLLDHSDTTWILLSTRDGRCFMWNINTGESKGTDFSEESKNLEYNAENLTHHKNAMFLSDGDRLVVSSFVISEGFSGMQFLIVDTPNMVSYDASNFSPDREIEWQAPPPVSTPPRSIVARLSTPLDFNFVVTQIEISADQSGLLVAVCDEQMENGYCILWTDFMMKPQLATRLSKGTMGTWSPRNDFVVTWTFPEEPYPEENDCGCAFLWNVKKQCQPAEFTEVQNTLGCNTLWCRFVLDMEGRDRLVMCILETTVTFLFWDIENKTLTHTITTSISAVAATACDRRAWMRSWVERSNVKGLSSIEVSTNMKQIGAVSESENRVMIWDATLGVQRLDIALPEGFRGKHEKGMDIMLSPTQPKFAVIRDISVLLFSPSTQSNLLSDTEVSQMIELENPNSGPDSKNAVFKMLFSHDGNALGVLNVGSSEMAVWHLLTGEKCIVKNDLKGDNIEDFCVSSNGDNLVTCTSEGVVCIWDCTSEHGSVTDSFRINSASMALGLRSNRSEIVLCSMEGTLFWYRSSDESASDMTTRLDSHERLTHVTWISSSSQESESDGNSPVYEQLDEPFMPSRSDVRATRHSPWSVSHKKQPLRGTVLHCRISSKCDRAIRLLETNEAEVWDLTEKEMLQITHGVDIASIRTPCTSQLLPLNGSGTIFDVLRDGVYASWNQVATPLNEATILSENADVILSSLSSLASAQGPTESADVLFQQRRTASSISIFVVNIKDPNHSRELKGCNLNPKRGSFMLNCVKDKVLVLGLAISPDGRHVACLSGKLASKLTVWTCYASDGLLPNYDSFALNYRSMDNDVLLEKLKSLLNQFGVCFMNCLHSCGTSFLVKAVLKNKPKLIKQLLKHAVNCNIKISMFLMKEVFVDGQLKSKYQSVVSIAIQQNAPETVSIMMKYLLRKVTYEHELGKTLEETLIPISKEYPQILLDVVSDPTLFVCCSEIQIPKRDPPSEGFFTLNNNSLNLSRTELEEQWDACCQGLKKARDETTTSTAAIGALPYKGICQIGSGGLLSHLITHGTHHSIFAAFALGALVAHKWRQAVHMFSLG